MGRQSTMPDATGPVELHTGGDNASGNRSSTAVCDAVELRSEDSVVEEEDVVVDGEAENESGTRSGDEDEEDLDPHGVSHNELIAAVERRKRTGRWQNRQKRNQAPQKRTPTRGETQNSREVRCANCGGKHSTP